MLNTVFLLNSSYSSYKTNIYHYFSSIFWNQILFPLKQINKHNISNRYSLVFIANRYLLLILLNKFSSKLPKETIRHHNRLNSIRLHNRIWYLQKLPNCHLCGNSVTYHIMRVNENCRNFYHVVITSCLLLRYCALNLINISHIG